MGLLAYGSYGHLKVQHSLVQKLSATLQKLSIRGSFQVCCGASVLHCVVSLKGPFYAITGGSREVEWMQRIYFRSQIQVFGLGT